VPLWREIADLPPPPAVGCSIAIYHHEGTEFAKDNIARAPCFASDADRA
jgi:hypothetical protein